MYVRLHLNIFFFLNSCQSHLRVLSNFLHLKQTFFSMVPDLTCFAVFVARDHESVKIFSYYFVEQR